jgi:hypothetical protein
MVKAFPIPPEARGVIGATATFLGIGTKAEENVEGTRSYWGANPSDRLLPMPDVIDPSWSEQDVEQIAQASELAASGGDISIANLWRNNLARPKGHQCSVPSLVRMANRIVELAAAKRGERLPTKPEQLLESFDDVQVHGAAYGREMMPAALQSVVVDELNRLLQAMAAVGYASRTEISTASATIQVQNLSCRYSSIQGASVRVINQIGHLLKVSRKGQTDRKPMTLGRRRLLVNSALQQLADHLGAEAWTVESLSLITDQVRSAWSDRDERQPPPPPRFTDLLSWADRDRPPPAELDLPDIERLIQQHSDEVYVELLRAERNSRVLAQSRSA